MLGLWDQSGFGAHLLSFLSKTETEGNEKLPLHISSWKNEFYKNTPPVDPKHLEPQILILSVCFTFFHLLRVKRGRIQNAELVLKIYFVILPDKNQHKINSLNMFSMIGWSDISSSREKMMFFKSERSDALAQRWCQFSLFTIPPDLCPLFLPILRMVVRMIISERMIPWDLVKNTSSSKFNTLM